VRPSRSSARWARVGARYTAAALVAAGLTVWLAAAGSWAPALLSATVMVGYLIGRQDARRRQRLATGVWATLVAEPDR